MLRFDVDPGLMGLGLKDATAPMGSPLTDKVTEDENPPLPVTPMTVLRGLPRHALAVDGVALSSKVPPPPDPLIVMLALLMSRKTLSTAFTIILPVVVIFAGTIIS